MDKHNFYNLCPIYKLGTEEIIKGKGKVVLCLIKHYAMKLYGEMTAVCILIILAMHEVQRACFYPPVALCWRKSPRCLLGRERVGSESVCTLEKRGKLCLCLEFKNKFYYFAELC